MTPEINISFSEIRAACGATRRQAQEAAEFLAPHLTDQLSEHVIGLFQFKKAAKIGTIEAAALRYLQGERAEQTTNGSNVHSSGNGHRLDQQVDETRNSHEFDGGVVGDMLAEDFQLADEISDRRVEGIQITSNLMVVHKLQKRQRSNTPGVNKSYELVRQATTGVINQGTDPFGGITLEGLAIRAQDLLSPALPQQLTGATTVMDKPFPSATNAVPNGSQTKPSTNSKPTPPPK